MSRFRDNENLIGESNSFLEVLEHVSRLAPLDKPVLIIGERGTGKELIAARLHYLSARWEQPYLKLNCAALNENLLESELFGHESGAFTGASKKHEGRFERADKGTLFLDELANTSPAVQEKLLRVIEYGEFERVGGSRPVKVDVRLIAATNEDLPALADRQEFRADLLDRLAFDVITLPPLRHRREDIMILAEHFAIQMTRELNLECFAGFTQHAKEALLDYAWPGNVRELKNVIERSLYRLNSSQLPLHDIVFDPFASPWRPTQAIRKRNEEASRNMPADPHTQGQQVDDESTAEVSESSYGKQTGMNGRGFPLPDLQTTVDFKDLSQNFETQVLSDALAHCQYNQKKTAELLGLTYHQLRGYLKKYQLLEATGKDD
ncbi:phage shock protein operon transcriptional activator [Aliidiomarina halalkaliphila]|uniref:Phage shock protein operon transcriptional activator n=1 Tax=Aliidiomarina halalkaliphila TaxID=2593535 RepID=A0A552X3Q4_9GAMM|nr:phage shock protein operon transcriptional activator [Aliidiomarina halalkaliphila]TRW49657.1 phage shock protein operon transcriptional activator [Aliidiomarina halalkaliphila]